MNKGASVWEVAPRLGVEVLDVVTFSKIASFLKDYEITSSEQDLRTRFRDFELELEPPWNEATSLRGTSVREHMSAPVRTVEVGLGLDRLCCRMTRQLITGFPVVNDSGQLVGIVSQADIVTAVAQDEPLETLRVGDLMTEYVITANPEADVLQVVHLMLSYRIHRVVVVNEQHKPVGIITSLDVAKVLAELNSALTRTSEKMMV